MSLDCVMGYKYFDFGEDTSTKTMEFAVKIQGTGCRSVLHVLIDDPENGKEIGAVEVGLSNGIYRARVENVTGRHALYFKVTSQIPKDHWMRESLITRYPCELDEFVFLK